MPRIIDILRGKKEEGDNHKDKKGQSETTNAPPLNFPKEILSVQEKKAQEDLSLVSQKLISTVKKYGVDSPEKAGEVYASAVEAVKALLEKAKNNEDTQSYTDKIHTAIDDISNQLILGENILDNIYDDKRKGEYYLPYHIVNITVLALFIGLSMGFNKSRLNHLGLAAILCDLGMDAFRGLISQPRQLSEEERNQIKAHITKSLEFVGGLSKINEMVIETIKKHHERINGLGYPRRLKGDNINLDARIIGLVDTYDAFTHERAYRRATSPHQAIRSIVGLLKGYFDPAVLKTFINRMSVYPIGSKVKLDSGELAKVISVPSGSPLRPVVMIIQDASGEPLKERLVIDLSKQEFPSIQESI